MQFRTILTVALVIPTAGCYLFFGPPRSRIQGWVYAGDLQTPLPRAEVCALGLDTVCVRADTRGHYSLSLTKQAVVFRFRFGSLQPAVSDTIHLDPPSPYAVNCALTDQLVLSDRPVPCQPVPGK
jgi:hypothetical protein